MASSRGGPFRSTAQAQVAFLALGLVAVARCSNGSGVQNSVSVTASQPSPTLSGMMTITPSSSPGPIASSSATITPTAVPTASATPNYQITETDNISYGPAAKEVLDAYVPLDGKALRPAVMLVHGGASVRGDKSELTHESMQIAQAGFTTFNINYTLATTTEPGYPTQGDEVQAAILWARANAAQFGVDPTRIGALGSSHGGELVALAALEGSGSQQTGSRLMAAVTWSGPTDLASLYALECSGSTSSCAHRAELEYLDCLYPQCPATYVAASPVTYVDSSDPPMAIFNSANELVPVSQATELANDLTAAGIYNLLTVYPGSVHAAGYSAQALGPTISFFETELYR